jgi:hypothetical protein
LRSPASNARLIAKSNGTVFGHEITREEFVTLDRGKSYDDIVCCGFGGAVVLRRKDGTIGVEMAMLCSSGASLLPFQYHNFDFGSWLPLRQHSQDDLYTPTACCNAQVDKLLQLCPGPGTINVILSSDQPG